MFETDSFGSVAGHFTNGNPATLTPATKSDAAWFNAVQDELVNVIEAAGLTLNKLDSTQLLQALQVMTGLVPSGGRNLLINGDMRVAQRRKTATFSNAGGQLTGFVLDRWLSGADTGAGLGVATVSRQPYTIGGVAGDPIYFLRHVQSTAPTVGQPFASQKIESVRGHSDGKRTVSVLLKGSGAFNVTARLTQNFGTGGSPSSPVIVGSAVFAVTTTLQAFSMTLTLPSIAGKTLGTAGNDHLLLELSFPNSGTYTVELGNVQVEAGDVASPFVRRPLGVELALCQRYFEKSYEVETDPGTPTELGATHWHNVSTATDINEAEAHFTVEKRAVPAITWYAGGSGNVGSLNIGGSIAVTGTTNISRKATGVPLIGSTAGTASGSAQWSADAEL